MSKTVVWVWKSPIYIPIKKANLLTIKTQIWVSSQNDSLSLKYENNLLFKLNEL